MSKWIIAFGACASLIVARSNAQSIEWCYDTLTAGPVVVREDSVGNLYFAVCQAQGELVIRRAESGTLHQSLRGDLIGLAAGYDETCWYISEGKIFSRVSREAAAVDRTSAFGQLLAPPRNMFVARGGELFVSGVTRYRTCDGLFQPHAATTASGAVVEVLADDPFGNEWGLARRADSTAEVVTRKKLDSVQWTTVAGCELRNWQSLLADDLGYVWLSGDKELLRIDPRHPDQGWKRFPTEQLSSAISALTRNPNNQVLGGFADGVVRELAFGTKGVVVNRELKGAGGSKEAIRALHVDGRGDLWVVSGSKIGRRRAEADAWQQNWREVSRLPAGNHDIIFARDGEQLYTAGGKTYFGFPATEWINLDEIWRYDVTRGMWRVDTPMLRSGKAYSGIATLQGEIWLIGGYLRAGNGTRAVADVEIYDPRSHRVRWGPQLEVARGQVVALTLNDRLFAIGGATDQRPLAVMASIGAGETSWREEAAPPGAIEQASGCVLNGKLYVAAGERSSCPGLFVYDPAQRRWYSVAHPTGKSPHAPLCAAHAGRVWILGGWGGSDGRAVYHYDPERQSWGQGKDLPLPLSWGAAIDVNGQLLIAGGAYRSDDVGDYFNSDRVFLLRLNADASGAR